MIGYLQGSFLMKKPGRVLVMAYGVGRWVSISTKTQDDISEKVGGDLFIHQIIREDADLLFGFYTEEELDMFVLLISVPGVGPSAAMTCLGAYSPFDLATVIANGQENLLVKIKGIGAKTAKQIILDLKGKIKEFGSDPIVEATLDPWVESAISALVGLGYTKTMARPAVKSVFEQHACNGVEDLIRKTLSMLSK